MKAAFYKGTRPGLAGLYNRLVRWWTRGPYSHCELVLHELATGESQCASSSFMDGGVRIKAIQLDPSHWDVVHVMGCSHLASTWLLRHQGKKYDLMGNFGFLFRPLADDKDRWFCSEAVAAMLGIQQPWRLDPNTLYALVNSFGELAGSRAWWHDTQQEENTHG